MELPGPWSAQAAEWLSAFDVELWTAAQVAAYQETIAAKTKALEQHSLRGIGQDFLMLPYYLTDELSTMVLAEDNGLLQMSYVDGHWSVCPCTK